MNNAIILNHIAERLHHLLVKQNMLFRDNNRPVFYVWPQPDRVICVIDPETIKNQQKILTDEFRHDLSTNLAGRRVRVSNSRGIFIQIAWMAEPALRALRSEPLDLSAQPSPVSVPLGLTKNGPMWLAIPDMDAVLVGGSRRMGKTRMLHAWIQALIFGGRSRLVLWDGKGGIEFGRYARMDSVTLASDLVSSMAELQDEMSKRGELLQSAGVSSVAEYNALHPEFFLPLQVLIIDEVAHVPETCRPFISDLVGRGGAYGIYPVLATTYPGHKEVQSLVRANLSTRICFPVPTMNESRVVLAQAGAETLPKIKGRFLIVWDAKVIEGQAFAVDLPKDDKAINQPRLNEAQMKIMDLAMQRGGSITMNMLTQSNSIHYTEWEARKLLQEWEGKGWLRKDPNRANGRIVTGLLAALYAQTSQAAQTPQTPTGGAQAPQTQPASQEEYLTHGPD